MFRKSTLFYPFIREFEQFHMTVLLFEFFDKMLNKRNFFKIINIASGSEANITTPCEMDIFNFLWLIWDHYLPLAPT